MYIYYWYVAMRVVYKPFSSTTGDDDLSEISPGVFFLLEGEHFRSRSGRQYCKPLRIPPEKKETKNFLLYV